MLRFRNINHKPPNGFLWKDPDTGADVIASAYHNWVAMVGQHRSVNQLCTVTEAEMQHHNCSRLDESARDVFCQSDEVPISDGARIPREKWPLWAKALVLLSRPEDTGLGDVIARTIGPIGGDAFRVWYEKIFKQSCGCGQRQSELNVSWPLISE